MLLANLLIVPHFFMAAYQINELKLKL